jgi:hypothetical protein
MTHRGVAIRNFFGFSGSNFLFGLLEELMTHKGVAIGNFFGISGVEAEGCGVQLFICIFFLVLYRNCNCISCNCGAISQCRVEFIGMKLGIHKY